MSKFSSDISLIYSACGYSEELDMFHEKVMKGDAEEVD